MKVPCVQSHIYLDMGSVGKRYPGAPSSNNHWVISVCPLLQGLPLPEVTLFSGWTTTQTPYQDVRLDKPTRDPGDYFIEIVHEFNGNLIKKPAISCDKMEQR